MAPWIAVLVLAVFVGIGSIGIKRRRRQAETELHRAVGAKVRALAEGHSILGLVEVFGTLVTVTPEFIELAGDYANVPDGAGRYVVGPALLRIPQTTLVEVTHDGKPIHVRT